MRSPAPKIRQPIDEHWRRVSEALHNRIKYRERELAELSQDYLALQAECRRMRQLAMRLHSERARTLNDAWMRDAANEEIAGQILDARRVIV